MFRTEKIAAYLNNFTGNGDDERKEVRLNIYVTPITHDLAREVSPEIADCLFSDSGGGQWNPRSVMPRSQFSIGEIPAQRVEFFPHPDETVEKWGVLCESARISNIRADRPFADKLDFRLIFDITVDMNSETLRIAQRFFKGPVFLTFTAIQEKLPFPPAHAVEGQPLCQVCNLLAAVIDSEMQTFCRDHVRAAKGAIKELDPDAPRESLKDVEARNKKEAAERYGKKNGDGAAHTEGAPIGEPGGPPAVDEADLKSEGAFINKRNSGRGRGKSTVN